MDMASKLAGCVIAGAAVVLISPQLAAYFIMSQIEQAVAAMFKRRVREQAEMFVRDYGEAASGKVREANRPEPRLVAHNRRGLKRSPGTLAGASLFCPRLRHYPGLPPNRRR